MDKSVQYRVWWKNDDVSALNRMGEVVSIKWQDGFINEVTAIFPNIGEKHLVKSEFDIMMSSPYVDIAEKVIYENDIFVDGKGITRIIQLGRFRKWGIDLGVGDSAYGWHTDYLSNIEIVNEKNRKPKCIALNAPYSRRFRVIGNLYQQNTEYALDDGK